MCTHKLFLIIVVLIIIAIVLVIIEALKIRQIIIGY